MALITFSCIFQTIVYLATRGGKRSILRGMTSNYVTWMFCYSSLTTFLILFAFIVQISVVAYAKIHVAAIRSTVGEVSFHLGNTVRYFPLPYSFLIFSMWLPPHIASDMAISCRGNPPCRGTRCPLLCTQETTERRA